MGRHNFGKDLFKKCCQTKFKFQEKKMSIKTLRWGLVTGFIILAGFWYPGFSLASIENTSKQNSTRLGTNGGLWENKMEAGAILTQPVPRLYVATSRKSTYRKENTINKKKNIRRKHRIDDPSINRGISSYKASRGSARATRHYSNTVRNSSRSSRGIGKNEFLKNHRRPNARKFEFITPSN